LRQVPKSLNGRRAQAPRRLKVAQSAQAVLGLGPLGLCCDFFRKAMFCGMAETNNSQKINRLFVERQVF